MSEEERLEFRRRLDESMLEGEIVYAGQCLAQGNVECYVKASKRIAEWKPIDGEEEPDEGGIRVRT